MRSALIALPIWLLAAASAAMAAQLNRITASIDGNQTVVLKGSVHAQARPEYDQGAADPSLPLPYVVLVTKPSATQQAELEQLLAQQQDPTSANYHKWLTPEQYADRFGLSPSDTEKITVWLRSQGFSIVQPARGRDWVAFNATAGLVENTFHTQIHRYRVDGELHFANAIEVAIPRALAGVVAGFRGLDDFRWRPMGVHAVTPPDLILPIVTEPFFTTGGGVNGSNFLAPGDFATIYDLSSLYLAGIDGAGMKLVVVGQVDVVMKDIEEFRSAFNLPANDPSVVLVPGSPDPGNNSSDLGESDLDLEWAGAVARNASIIFVTSSTTAGGGVFNAAAYAIDTDLAPVISMSYGGCETRIAAFIAANEPTMQKANAEGITFVAASGDSGPANCDLASESSASGGLAVSYPASSPEVTAVGGTEFSGDLPPNTSQFWGITNGPNGGSAIMYIPETSWNDAAEPPASLASSGGGKSSCHASPCTAGFPKPSWQAGTGVPNDGVRDVPDISFSASANHDGYLTCSAGSCANSNFAVVGGTSASTPVFAGIIALLNQQLGNLPPGGLGNVNPTLYKLAQTPANNVFHDITTGNNIIPCTQGSPQCPKTAPFQFGFSAGVGYDLVTGLGSIDVNNLFTNWNNGKVATTPVLSVSPTTFDAGSTQTVMLTAAVNPNAGGGTPTGVVAFFVNGTTPVGVGTLSHGSASFSFDPKSLKAGVNTFVAEYAGDVNFINSKSSAVMATVQDFTVTLPSNPTTVTIAAPGGSSTTKLTITPEFGFNQAVSFSCTGLPSEATCSAGSVTPNGAPVMTTLTIMTAPAAARLQPQVRSRSLFYALLIPGLLGVICLPAKRGKSRFRWTRLLILGLLFVSLWSASCGGGSSTTTPPNPGTPAGTTTATVVAAGVGGAPSHSVQITLTIK
jgi:subtilase family serine protease